MDMSPLAAPVRLIVSLLGTRRTTKSNWLGTLAGRLRILRMFVSMKQLFVNASGKLSLITMAGCVRAVAVRRI